jgi:RimJ/RimL family protein N-acetyltransferase
MNPILTGQLVKLTAQDPENDPKILAPWHRDSEFFQLAYGRLAEPWTAQKIKERLERHSNEPNDIAFSLRTLADDKLIGQMGMYLEPPHGDGFVWILIGEREYWGKGYGTDAMRVMLRYGFDELNLHRVSLRTFGFNGRAVRSYEKVGFVHEGKCRNALNRLGQRWDEIWMGITREEFAKASQ